MKLNNSTVFSSLSNEEFIEYLNNLYHEISDGTEENYNSIQKEMESLYDYVRLSKKFLKIKNSYNDSIYDLFGKYQILKVIHCERKINDNINQLPKYKTIYSLFKLDENSVIPHEVTELDVATLYNEKNVMVDYTNSIYELYDWRIQIRDKKLNGYHISYKGNDYPITNNGYLYSICKEPIFPLLDEYLDKICNI